MQHGQTVVSCCSICKLSYPNVRDGLHLSMRLFLKRSALPLPPPLPSLVVALLPHWPQKRPVRSLPGFPVVRASNKPRLFPGRRPSSPAAFPACAMGRSQQLAKRLIGLSTAPESQFQMSSWMNRINWRSRASAKWRMWGGLSWASLLNGESTVTFLPSLHKAS